MKKYSWLSHLFIFTGLATSSLPLFAAYQPLTNLSITTPGGVVGVLPFGSGGTGNSTSYTAGSVVFSNGTSLTQDNPSLFWDDTNIALGIGKIPSPTTTVIDAVNTGGNTRPIQETGYSSNVGFRAMRANGTVFSPSAAATNDILAFFSGRGYGATGFPAASTGAINVTALENFTDTTQATSLVFETTASGSVTALPVLTMSSTTNRANFTFGNGFNAFLVAGSGATNGQQIFLEGGSGVTGSGGPVTVIGGNAAATAGAGGGAVNITGAPGTSTGTGGAGGGITLASGAGAGDSTVNQAGGPIALNVGASVGSSSGSPLSLSGGTGGIGTATAGANGGQININGGVGGAGSATSGNGGTSTFRAGAGGAGVAGGDGGVMNLLGGTAGSGSANPGNGGSVLVSGGGAASADGSSGGAVSLIGAAGSATFTGGSGGTVNITGGNAGGNNTTNRSGGNITILAGLSKGSATGASINTTAGAGGTGTGTAGVAGGSITQTSGVGGAGSATSGAGGNTTITSGAGGAGVGGGAGGSTTISSGTGGAGSTTSGAGGSTSITSANGGASASAAGAVGGALTLTAGSGGNGSTAGGTGGALTLNAGLAGAGGTGVGGAIIFKTGPSTTSIERARITNGGLFGIGNISPTYLLDVLGGNVGVGTAGDGFRVKEGSNAKQGVATLVAGTLVVANTSVTTVSRIFITPQSLGTITLPASYAITARTAGTSFTITSSAVTDTSSVAWEMFEPY